MAIHQSRLFSSILKLSSSPKLGLSSYVRSSESTTARRFVCSSTQQHPQRQDQGIDSNKVECEESQNGKEENIGDDEDGDDGVDMNQETGEIGGPRGPEPTRYGDWERNGRCSDF